MELSTMALPSKGFGTPIEFIEVSPMTYTEVMRYTSRTPSTSVDKFLWELECVLSGIKNYELLSSYDAKALIFHRKYISVTTDSKIIKLSIDNKEYRFDISTLEFKDISPKLTTIEGITLCNKFFKFSVPNIKRLMKTLRVLNTIAPNTSIKDAYFISAVSEDDPVNKILDVMNEATHKDITLIDYCSTLLYSVCKPVQLEGGLVIGNIDDLITDFFRSIINNNEFDASQIKYKEEL